MISTDNVTARCVCGADFECLRWIFDMARGQSQGPVCPACTERHCADEEAREAAERRRRIEDAVVKDVPERYKWATFEALAALPADERARRVKDPTGIQRAIAASGSTRVVLSGPAGSGKTLLAMCLVRVWAKQKGRSIAVVDGYELASARARASLGEEAPAVVRALRAGMLVLDDLGAKVGNPQFDATSDVIHDRHKSEMMTVVTTGFSVVDLKAKYGDGIARRLFEDAAHIELRPTRRS